MGSSLVDAGYKNTVGSREECSYNRYVLITGTLSMGKDRNGSHTYNGSYNRYVLIPVFL